MKKYLFFVFFTFFGISSLRAEVKSYADIIEKLSEKNILEFSSKYNSSHNGNIHLTCLETNDNKQYIGLWHTLTINSKLLDAVKVMEDFDNYPEVFEGIKNSKVMKKTGLDKWIVEFEDRAPAFFLPNIHYQMEYSAIDVINGKIYKYHLSNLYQQNSIIHSDGLIFLKEENGITRFYELDFFNANWGVVGKIAGANIWSDSISELAISDFELKFKSENLKLSSSEKKEKMQASNKLMTNEHLIEKCIKDKVYADQFFK